MDYVKILMIIQAIQAMKVNHQLRMANFARFSTPPNWSEMTMRLISPETHLFPRENDSWPILPDLQLLPIFSHFSWLRMANFADLQLPQSMPTKGAQNEEWPMPDLQLFQSFPKWLRMTWTGQPHPSHIFSNLFPAKVKNEMLIFGLHSTSDDWPKKLKWPISRDLQRF